MQTEQERSRCRRYQWTPVHSFYALMGGFVFDDSRNSDSFPSSGGEEQVVIHRTLLLWLAENEPDLIPDISTGHITDKSKANRLAKFLACIQASWFGLQVITRLGLGLAVTLLELNVFAHVVCALLTYAFWWNKPLDIDEPTRISTDDPKADSICAAVWSRAALGRHTPLVVQKPGQSTTELMCLWRNRVVGVEQLVFSPQHAQDLWSECFSGRSVTYQQGSRYFSNQGYISEDILLRLSTRRRRKSYRDNLNNRIYIELSSALVKAVLERSKVHLGTGVLGPEDRVYVAFEDHHLERHLSAHSHPVGLTLISIASPGFKFDKMRPRIRNLYDTLFDGDDNVTDATPHIWILSVAGMLYGAWHLTAWNGPFRTTAEEILWKASAVGVAAGLMLLSALGFVSDQEDKLGAKLVPVIIDPTKWPRAVKVLGLIVLLPCGFLFSIVDTSLWCFLIFSRTYLVVESFISLAFVPDTVFALPKWSSYFPHIG